MIRRLASVAAFALAIVGGGQGADAALTGPAIGAPAPDFAFTALDGRQLSLAALRGKTVVVNVFGSWCPPCRFETPDLNAEAELWKNQGVVFIGVDTTETAAVAHAFATAKGVPYPIVVVPGDSPFAKAYDIRNYPTTFVIDPQGVLRARHADNLLPRPQLHASIVAARRGASVPVDTAFQRQLDALLDPAHFTFTGDSATVLASASAAADAIAKANDLQDDAMSDATRDHDLLRTQEEEAKLRDAAITALAASNLSDPGNVLLARLRGDQALALGQWDVASAAYARALELAPNDVGALSGAERAAQQRGDTAAAYGFAARIANAAPSFQTEVALARASAKNGDRDGAFAAFDRALALASTPATRAWTLLATGRVAVQLGDLARARRAFAAAADNAAQVPPPQPGFTLYSEQAQEAMIALGPAPGARVGISAAPWTGADMPGSIASTVKYRIAVTAAPHTPVRLVASGLPKDWVGSWCTDRVCQPTRTDVVVPTAGLTIVEFQVVPDDPKHASLHPQVRIDAKAATIASVTVRG